jgi:hypothetical protein
MPLIDYYSCGSALQEAPDGRTKQARLLKSFRTELEAQIGGNPTILQRALIDHVAYVQPKIARLQDGGSGYREINNELTNLVLARMPHNLQLWQA